MIRPFTIIAMLLAALSGAYLFAVKHRAQVLDDEIAAYSQSSRLDAMRIRVLQGQWSLETDPTRLQQLAAQFTTLQPMQPAQLVTLASLRESLPAPGSAAPGRNPALPVQAEPQLTVPEVARLPSDPQVAQNLTAPGATGVSPLPLPPPQAPQAPVRMASLTPVQVASRPVAHRVSHSSLHLANMEMAESLPPPRPYVAPRPVLPVERVAQGNMAPPSMPMGAQVMSVKATPVSQYVPPAAQDGGSMLGMAASVAPPRPMPQNGNEN